jgi:hypothetical protein
VSNPPFDSTLRSDWAHVYELREKTRPELSDLAAVSLQMRYSMHCSHLYLFGLLPITSSGKLTYTNDLVLMALESPLTIMKVYASLSRIPLSIYP